MPVAYEVLRMKHYETIKQSAPLICCKKIVMNAKCASILTNPHPCSHIVYPYTDERLVTEAVCLFASAGFRKNEAVVLIMTAEHCDPIERRLAMEGFDLAALRDSGQLICEDA